MKGTSLYKIGITKCLEQRLLSLRTANPYTLEVRLLKLTKNEEQDRFFEQTLHLLYKEKQEQLEWFNLNFYDLNKIEDFFGDSFNTFFYCYINNCLVQYDITYQIFKFDYNTLHFLNKEPIVYEQLYRMTKHTNLLSLNELKASAFTRTNIKYIEKLINNKLTLLGILKKK